MNVAPRKVSISGIIGPNRSIDEVATDKEMISTIDTKVKRPGEIRTTVFRTPLIDVEKL